MARSSPGYRFAQQRCNARQRGIGWELTFVQWWGIWQTSGKWEQRGNLVGQYVMARHGDTGPYSVANVRICTSSENLYDAYVNGRIRNRKAIAGEDEIPTTPLGWTLQRGRKTNPYKVMFRSKYIGVFPTREAAEAAYQAQRERAASTPTLPA